MIVLASTLKKATWPMRAAELYRGELFVRGRRIAEGRGESWIALSALHGVVEPDQILPPYDVALSGLTAADRRTWVRRAGAQLRELVESRGGIREVGGITVLAGRVYCAAVEESGLPYASPLAGLGIGGQLAKLAAWERQARMRGG